LAEEPDEEVERRARAPEEDEVRRSPLAREERHLKALAALDAVLPLRDLEEAVGLGERRDGARALEDRVGDEVALLPGDQVTEDELVPPGSRGHAHRERRLSPVARFLPVETGEDADHRLDEQVEGKRRARREAREDRDRLL